VNLPTQVDKYELKQLLGQGHYGSVYGAYDTLLDKAVALKLVPLDGPSDPREQLSRFSEAVLQHRSEHRNVVRVHEANILSTPEGPVLGIAMDLVSGGSLQDRVNARFLSTRDCLLYFGNIVMGLEYLHAAHIVHRDIKPSNILLSQDRAKLSDFGLAGIVEAGRALGGEAYVTHKAPECFETELSFDILTDIYALGMTLFRCVNNISNWRDRLAAITDLDIRLHQGSLVEHIGFEPYVPRELRKIVLHATAPDRTKRYQAVVEMQRNLDRLKISLDWRRLDTLHWQAQGYSRQNRGDVYLLSVSGADVVLTKNDRRLTSLCQRHPTHDAALSAAYAYISSTTIA